MLPLIVVPALLLFIAREFIKDYRQGLREEAAQK